MCLDWLRRKLKSNKGSFAVSKASDKRPLENNARMRRKVNRRLIGMQEILDPLDLENCTVGSTPGNRGEGGERVTTVVGCRRSAGGGSGQPGRNLLPAWRLLAPRLGAEASALFVTERATPVLLLLVPLGFGLHGCLGCYPASARGTSCSWRCWMSAARHCRT